MGVFDLAALGREVTIVYFVSLPRGCGTKGECVCDVILVCVCVYCSMAVSVYEHAFLKHVTSKCCVTATWGGLVWQRGGVRCSNEHSGGLWSRTSRQTRCRVERHPLLLLATLLFHEPLVDFRLLVDVDSDLCVKESLLDGILGDGIHINDVFFYGILFMAPSSMLALMDLLL